MDVKRYPDLVQPGRRDPDRRLAAILRPFFVLIAISSTALGCPFATEPAFESLIQNSTLIVRGQVLSETGDKEWTNGERQHLSELLIERTYKGASSPIVHVSWKSYLGCPRAALPKEAYGLFFLRVDGSEFVLSDQQFGNVVVSRSEDETEELEPLAAFERDFKQAIRRDSGRQLIEDVLLLGSLRQPVDTTALHALLPTHDDVLESAVHLALLKLLDYSELEAAGKLVEAVPDDRTYKLPEQEAVYLRTQIGTEIERIKAPRQLPILQQFTLSSNLWLRQNAAYAIRHLADASSVPFLFRLIDDPSEETRMQAIYGLVEILKPGSDWIPGTPLDGRKTTEQEVIARWHAWWEAEGESKYGK